MGTSSSKDGSVGEGSLPSTSNTTGEQVVGGTSGFHKSSASLYVNRANLQGLDGDTASELPDEIIVSSDAENQYSVSVSKRKLSEMNLAKAPVDLPLGVRDGKIKGEILQHFVDHISSIVTVPYFASGGEVILEAIYSPVFFPSYLCAKQIGAICPNLQFHRQRGPNKTLLHTIVNDLVVRKMHVALLGSPGYGKSGFLNLILIELLKLMLLSVDSFDVYLRLGSQLFCFSNIDGAIVVHFCDNIETCYQIGDYMAKNSKYKRCILLLELFEDDTSVVFEELMQTGVVIFLTLPNSNADDTLTALIKQRNLQEYFYGMCSWEEIFCMGVSMIDYVGDEAISSLPWALDASGAPLTRDAALHQLIHERVDCGPIPRFCFVGLRVYKDRMNDIHMFRRIALESLQTWSTCNIPENVSLFIGLSVKPNVALPKCNKDSAEFMLVSDFAKCALAPQVAMPSSLTYLKKSHLFHQLYEAVARHGLALQKRQAIFEKGYQMKEWHAYVDLGNCHLVHEYQYDRRWFAHLRSCVREQKYTGTVFTKRAEAMEEGVLYSSVLPANELFDFIYRVGRVVYLVQVSQSLPQEHSCSIGNVSECLKRLGLNEAASAYNAIYVYVTDPEEITHFKGVVMTWEDPKSADKKRKLDVGSESMSHRVGLLQWRTMVEKNSAERPPSEYDWIVHKLHTVVVRARFTPLLTQQPVMSKHGLTAQQLEKILTKGFGEVSSRGGNKNTLIDRIETNLKKCETRSQRIAKYLKHYAKRGSDSESDREDRDFDEDMDV